AVFEAFGDAHDFADGDAAALLGKAITAARPAHAPEHTGAHELLHDLFEVALRHALARGDLFRLHRFGPSVEGDVDHRFQREQCFSGELEHQSTPVPVEPKPPSPRAVSGSSSTPTMIARLTRASTSCATFMPRFTVNAWSPRLMRMALISPR